ncbi:MAG: hypothetical protein QF535_11155, partial [Anaerolineales bacterium]|nr:hypothetical protein [Anaerolineales bacterium]
IIGSNNISSSYIGIGTASPEYELDVRGKGNFTDDVTIGNFFVDVSAGNVGIGTTSPTAQLEVKSTGVSTEVFTLQGSDGDSDLIQIYEGSDGSGNIRLHNDAGTENVRLHTADNSWLNGGNVGIGDTTPDATFDVHGDVVFGDTNSGNLKFDVGTAASMDILLTTSDAADSSQMRLGGGGDVINTRGAIIYLRGNEYSGSEGILRLEAGNVATGDMVFKTQAATRMHIDYNGNVGIGTTNPTKELHIIGDIKLDDSDAQIVMDGGSVESLIYTGSSDFQIGATSNHDLAFLSNNGKNMVLKAGGNVGIGTTNPWDLLTVMGDISLTGGDLRVGTGTATSTLTSASGKLGLGTTTPNAFFSIQDGVNPSIFEVTDSNTMTLALSIASTTGEILTRGD